MDYLVTIVPELGGAVLWFFLNMNGAQDTTVRSSIGAPEVVRHDGKHTRSIILKLAKFFDHVDSYSLKRQYYCNSSGKSKVFDHSKLKERVHK